jgi:GT2 family glycosyltransferase
MDYKRPIASVIVLNWNGKRFLSKCIASLLEQDCTDYEILLVDNGSVDNSVELVLKEFGKNPRLRIIELGYNYGFSKGNNLGIKCANGKYVIVLNNDTEVKPNFVSKLVAVADSGINIASVSCKIMHYDGTVWFGQYFTNGGFIVPFFTQSFSTQYLNRIYNKSSQNLANSGCAVLYKKDVLDKIEGFDEEFWTDWEDYDLGFRTNLAGFKSVYTPEFLVVHLGGGSAGSSPERYVRIYRNMLFTYFKNYDTKDLLTRFPLFLFALLPALHYGWILHRLITRPSDFHRNQSLQYLLSLEKSIIRFLLNLKIFVRKRYYIQRLRKVSDSTIFSNTHLKGVC